MIYLYYVTNILLVPCYRSFCPSKALLCKRNEVLCESEMTGWYVVPLSLLISINSSERISILLDLKEHWSEKRNWRLRWTKQIVFNIELLLVDGARMSFRKTGKPMIEKPLDMTLSLSLLSRTRRRVGQWTDDTTPRLDWCEWMRMFEKSLGKGQIRGDEMALVVDLRFPSFRRLFFLYDEKNWWWGEEKTLSGRQIALVKDRLYQLHFDSKNIRKDLL